MADLRLATSAAVPLSLEELAAITKIDLESLARPATSFAYGSPSGPAELRELIAAQYPGLAQDNVVVTAGAGGALAGLTWSLTGRAAQHFIVQLPTHQSITAFLERANLPVTELEAPIDVDELIGAITPKTSAVFLTSPHSPTGQVIDASDLIAIAGALERVGGLLVVDEVFSGIGIGKPVQPPAATLVPNAVSVASLSKVYGLPGLRVGWVAGPLMVVDDVRSFQLKTTRSVAALSDTIALSALGSREALLVRTQGFVSSSFATLAALCERHHGTVRLRVPDGGTTALIDLGDVDVDDWCRDLVERRGLLLAPGNACFGIPGHVSVNLAAQPEALERAVPILDAAFGAISVAASEEPLH